MTSHRRIQLVLSWLRRAVLLLLAWGGMSLAWAGDEERKLEAVFLGRFASYIEWPANNRSTVIITLIDENPFGALLDELYKNKKIHDKPIDIKYVTKVEDIGITDILFITLDTVQSRQAAIDHAQKNAILSISEAKGFAEHGGLIQINFVEQRPHITINHEAAVKSRIKIAAPLLSIAHVIKEQNK